MAGKQSRLFQSCYLYTLFRSLEIRARSHWDETKDLGDELHIQMNLCIDFRFLLSSLFPNAANFNSCLSHEAVLTTCTPDSDDDGDDNDDGDAQQREGSAKAASAKTTGKSRNWVYNLTYKARVIHDCLFINLLLLFLFYSNSFFYLYYFIYLAGAAIAA